MIGQNNNYNTPSNKRCYIEVSRNSQNLKKIIKHDKPKQRVLIRVK